ncbi:MAG TPA: hypothetical protein VK995_04140 [Oceanipulchritudo sp.]|nr:hypothetical protein [Oceanipulchritudo sp.]
MDISIRSVDEASALSGEAFVPGDLVWSYLYRGADGQLERMDIHERELEQLQLPGPVVCRWSQRVKSRSATEAEERRAALQTADEVFLSLFDDIPEGEADPAALEARERLKFFLALQLERKRVLKPLGSRRYKHMPTKRELTVPDMEITSDLLASFQGEIGQMGGDR